MQKFTTEEMPTDTCFSRTTHVPLNLRRHPPYPQFQVSPVDTRTRLYMPNGTSLGAEFYRGTVFSTGNSQRNEFCLWCKINRSDTHTHPILLGVKGLCIWLRNLQQGSCMGKKRGREPLPTSPSRKQGLPPFQNPV